MSETTEIPDFKRLLLTAQDDENPSRSAPLGERAQVAKLLAELLPRLVFDDAGTGTFKRGAAELTVHFVGDPVSVIEMMLRPAHLAALLPPLQRISARTGWQLVDADEGRLLAGARPDTKAAPRRARTVLRWALGAVAMVPVLAGAAWWAFEGSQGQLIVVESHGTADDGPGLPNDLNQAAADLSGLPQSPEQLRQQAQQLAEIMERRRSLAPAFRNNRIVHDLLMVDNSEVIFVASVGNGRYVDPAMLVEHSDLLARMNVPGLPPRFKQDVRGGYRFSFSGEGLSGRMSAEMFGTGFANYVYLAAPEPDTQSPLSFALRSATGKVHWTTDGRIPTASDPSVTDSVAVENDVRLQELPAEEGDTELMGKLKSLINNFWHSKAAQESELAFHEARAIKDLREFAKAQQVLNATINGAGYGAPEVLSNLSLLPNMPPEMTPLLPRSFRQEVREGYRFHFTGLGAVNGSSASTLYREYVYSAVPVGSGPPDRRSFAIRPDGVMRFRTDGTEPTHTDPVVD